MPVTPFHFRDEGLKILFTRLGATSAARWFSEEISESLQRENMEFSEPYVGKYCLPASDLMTQVCDLS